MEIVLDIELARSLDRKTIEIFGYSPLILMENAGERIYQEILKREIIKQNNKVVILAGKGNNGGDSIVVARKLKEKGINPIIFLFSKREEVSELNLINLNIASNIGLQIIEVNEKNYNNNIKNIIKSDIIMDGLLGIGITSPVSGIYKNLIEDINHEFKGKVIAIDTPSGLSTGKKFYHPVLKANYTFTIEYPKLNMIDYPGREYCGEIIAVKIGLPKEALDETKYFLVEEDDIKLPERPKNSHKGSYGRFLIIGGSQNYSGAPVISIKGAIESGCGLIYYFGYSEHIVRNRYPEVIILDNIEFLPSFDSILIGPGWKKDRKLFETIIEKYKGNLIIDAEGINLIAENKEILKNRKNTLLTPHIGEFARLIEKDVNYVKENKIEALENYITKYPDISILLKDSVSVLYHLGKFYYLDFGNDLLARGGSGDLLAGLIGGLSAYNNIQYSVFLSNYMIGKAVRNAKNKGRFSISTEKIINYFYHNNEEVDYEY
ncbi:MAG TPA: NAD(P)H-hydrate dehydratase [Spirochaetota bacterium]|nr:NAD(P)H-hydrate dehydratase [Spirochaetota bacterium]HOM38104.1 NAD(P)H-hydrate dehydratase [Spirochaetota bacterium]HPQ48906.1 NAD(P)H-hydrate dehydratase [Spirochaetota bacterium]